MRFILHSLVNCPQLQKRLLPHQFTDFCWQLQKSDEVLDADAARKLLDLFCIYCWNLASGQQSCYEIVSAVLLKSSHEARIKLIPLLMKKSIVYNKFVFLALKMLEGLTGDERQVVEKIYPPSWTRDDEYSSITAAEYAYRQSRGFECWIHKFYDPSGKVEKDYRRPSCRDDLRCFEAMLYVIIMSGQEVHMFLKGY